MKGGDSQKRVYTLPYDWPLFYSRHKGSQLNTEFQDPRCPTCKNIADGRYTVQGDLIYRCSYCRKNVIPIMATHEEAMALAPANGVYDFDLNDFGIQPEFDKEEMNGKVVFIHGISEATFQSAEFQTPARSLLWNWPTDEGANDPNGWHYGMLLSVDSPAIRQAAQMKDRGRCPFVARILKRQSEAHKSQSYWTLERYVMQYDSEGNILDPNETVIGKKAK